MPDDQLSLPPARYEHQDVAFQQLAIGLLGTLGALLLSLLLVILIYPSIVVDQRLSGPLPRYPEPTLQTDPPADLRHFVAQELQQLNSAGWMDRAQGIAHIPIEQAMQQVARQGIVDWPHTRAAAP
jgi:hypothetical protein